MKNVTVKPQAGDSLVVEKFMSGKGIKRVKPHNTKVEVVYEDGQVRSVEGDIFTVQLKHRATDKHTAQWVTVA